jgi:hypothetical protein
MTADASRLRWGSNAPEPGAPGSAVRLSMGQAAGQSGLASLPLLRSANRPTGAALANLAVNATCF